MSEEPHTLPLLPKKARNRKGLQLAPESLAPPDPSSDEANDQTTPTNYSTSILSLPTKSSVSKKKPAGLDVSKSIPTRAAPLNPAEVEGLKRKKKSKALGGDDDGSSGSSPTSQSHGDAIISSRNSYHNQLSTQLSGLDISSSSSSSHPKGTKSGKGKAGSNVRHGEDRVELRAEDLKVVGELGAGNGGTVNRVVHGPTGLVMARKLVLIDAKPSIRKQILRELQIMHDCDSEWIVSFHGAFLADPHVVICMECMDRGSLDSIYRKNGPIPILVVGKIAEAVLLGLTYLYDVHRIIHRDIKPSNILFNSKGQIKICDFGVSGELVNSIANTFVGTSTYMSPERIQGANYTVKSDVWSLGISLIELALGRFPFSSDDEVSSDDDSDLKAISLANSQSTISALPPPPMGKKEKRKSKGVSLGGGGMTMSILDLLQHIVNEPAPRLNGKHHTAETGGSDAGEFPKEAEEFVERCLRKDPEERATPKELLAHQWLKIVSASDIDLVQWAKEIATVEKD